MSTFWDEFLEERRGNLPSTRRELLRAFYMYLVERKVITD